LNIFTFVAHLCHYVSPSDFIITEYSSLLKKYGHPHSVLIGLV